MQTVCHDIKRLMALAFPGETGPMAESTAIDIFAKTLGDRNLRAKILEKSPATVLEALNMALKYEAIDKSGRIDIPGEFDKDGNLKREKGYVHVVEAHIDDDRLRQLEKALLEFQR